MPEPSSRMGNDLILAPGEFAYVADSASGGVTTFVGPTKKTIGDNEHPMRFRDRGFEKCTTREAIERFPFADETSYIVLWNPAGDGTHPREKTGNDLIDLDMGRRINLHGPATFSLWPRQVAKVIKGHQLRRNQYAIVRVYNAKAANATLGEAVVEPQRDDPKPGEETVSPPRDDATITPGEAPKLDKNGQLKLVLGTETSLYIPNTGLEVLPDREGNFVRNALSLENLEYCILKDETGEKRYVHGPDLVFPKSATEKYQSGPPSKSDGKRHRKFRAIELNPQMGLYVKVIADYTDADGDHKVGDELFITGATRKIYCPRQEHSVIKYGDDVIHYAVAVPPGEARYVLSKDSGEIDTEKGPQMLLPDPRHAVIILRVLDPKEVELWFPGSGAALLHNQQLAAMQQGDTSDRYVTRARRSQSEQVMSFAASASAEDMMEEFAGDKMERRTSFTKPRTVTLDTKFDGAVMIDVWTGFAVNVNSRSGNRRVEVGPTSFALEYDETLEAISFSTGTPKTEDNKIRTVYLKVANNKISDVVEATTSDLVDVSVYLSYRVNFEGDPNKWFDVDDYVKLLCDHTRSRIRASIKAVGIEEFCSMAIDIVRESVLGAKPEDGDRPGLAFERENGMHVYDVEVLDVIIGDKDIDRLLHTSQTEVVKNQLDLAAAERKLELTRKSEAVKQEAHAIVSETALKKLALDVEETKASQAARVLAIEHTIAIEQQRGEADKAAQAIIDFINESEIKRLEMRDLRDNDVAVKEAEVFCKRVSAIQDDLIQALVSLGDKSMITALVENLPKATGTVGFLTGNGGLDALIGMVKGTPMEAILKNIGKLPEPVESK